MACKVAFRPKKKKLERVAPAPKEIGCVWRLKFRINCYWGKKFLPFNMTALTVWQRKQSQHCRLYVQKLHAATNRYLESTAEIDLQPFPPFGTESNKKLAWIRAERQRFLYFYSFFGEIVHFSKCNCIRGRRNNLSTDDFKTSCVKSWTFFSSVAFAEPFPLDLMRENRRDIFFSFRLPFSRSWPPTNRELEALMTLEMARQGFFFYNWIFQALLTFFAQKTLVATFVFFLFAISCGKKENGESPNPSSNPLLLAPLFPFLPAAVAHSSNNGRRLTSSSCCCCCCCWGLGNKLFESAKEKGGSHTEIMVGDEPPCIFSPCWRGSHPILKSWWEMKHPLFIEMVSPSSLGSPYNVVTGCDPLPPLSKKL